MPNILVHIPHGAFPGGARDALVRRINESMPEGDKRMLATSVMLNDIADGTWGAGGALWKLPDFARAASYTHLQHLCAPEVSA